VLRIALAASSEVESTILQNLASIMTALADDAREPISKELFDRAVKTTELVGASAFSAGAGEPVAWMCRSKGEKQPWGNWLPISNEEKNKETDDFYIYEYQPLYAAPPVRDREAIKNIVALAISDGEYIGRNGPAMYASEEIALRQKCLIERTEAILSNHEGTPALSLPSTPVSDDWHSADDLPPLKTGHMREYVIAVFRGRSEKVYSFAASYLNAFPLQYEWCPKDAKATGGCADCDDGCPTTGWFVQTGDEDDGSTFQSLSLKDGDKIMGWRDIPQWDCRTATGVSVTSHDGETA
jgi:hypothetical protein